MSRFYPTSYYGARQEPAERHRSRLKKRAVDALVSADAALAARHPDTLSARLRETYVPDHTDARLLDYGCGSSSFLDFAHAKGWKTIGADLSAEVLEKVRAAGHDAVGVDPKALEEIQNSSLSLVRLNHVVEHLYHPRSVLAVLHRKLRPGGVIHLSTPNPDSIAARIFRTFWLGLDCPRHLMLYPPQTLAELLVGVGFREVEVVHEVLTKDTARSLGHVLHGLHLLPHERILVMADMPMLDALLRVPARFAAVRGRSDRYHCFASA